nr:TetR family transcriptional regulator [uncultured Pseudomonas sp.]
MDKNLSKGEQTRKAIRLAISSITNGRPKVVAKDRKISIKAVAEEAGVSNATIHNNYPDLAEQIRLLSNNHVRQQRDDTKQALSKQRQTTSVLRAEIKALRAQLSDIASVNAALMLQNAEMSSRLASTNVVDLKKF